MIDNKIINILIILFILKLNNANYIPHTFRVLVTDYKVDNIERLALSGNDIALGNWSVQNTILMHRIENGSEWYNTVLIPANKQIQYCYLIVEIDLLTQRVNRVRNWEYFQMPRTLSVTPDGMDHYGHQNYDKNYFSENDWLTDEFVVQLKFFNYPFKLNKNYKIHAIEILPDAVSKNNIRKIEVSNLKFGQSRFESKTIFENYNKNDDIIFQIKLNDLKSFHVKIRIYLQDIRTNEIDADFEGNFKLNNSGKYNSGYYYLTSQDFIKSQGELKDIIISPNFGLMDISYLIIKPFKKTSNSSNLQHTLHWNSEWNNLRIGHRGLGSTLRFPDGAAGLPSVTENTIASFSAAGKLGAKMIEFDVHVTEDLVPIIYHDFNVHTYFGSGTPTDIKDLTEISLCNITYKELKKLKNYSIINNKIHPRNIETLNEDFHMFPTLREALTKVNTSIAFDIEIKWPQEFINNGSEGFQSIDMNIFVDNILHELFKQPNERFILLSCFSADICTMLKLKQNKYPVFFGTVSDLSSFPLYKDPRTHSIESGLAAAIPFNYDGIIPPAIDIIMRSDKIILAKKLNKKLLTWWSGGIETEEEIKNLINYDLDGIIYDIYRVPFN